MSEDCGEVSRQWQRLRLELKTDVEAELVFPSRYDGGRGSRWVVVNTDAEPKCDLLLKLTLC